MPTVPVKCHRTIQWHGKVSNIVCDGHMLAYSGTIPCTGALRCIYCGKYEHEIKKEEEQNMEEPRVEEPIMEDNLCTGTTPFKKKPTIIIEIDMDGVNTVSCTSKLDADVIVIDFNPGPDMVVGKYEYLYDTDENNTTPVTAHRMSIDEIDPNTSAFLKELTTNSINKYKVVLQDCYAKVAAIDEERKALLNHIAKLEKRAASDIVTGSEFILPDEVKQ